MVHIRQGEEQMNKLKKIKIRKKVKTVYENVLLPDLAVATAKKVNEIIDYISDKGKNK